MARRAPQPQYIPQGHWYHSQNDYTRRKVEMMRAKEAEEARAQKLITDEENRVKDLSNPWTGSIEKRDETWRKKWANKFSAPKIEEISDED
jgi:hypothetical protein